MTWVLLSTVLSVRTLIAAFSESRTFHFGLRISETLQTSKGGKVLKLACFLGVRGSEDASDTAIILPAGTRVAFVYLLCSLRVMLREGLVIGFITGSIQRKS